jgi:Tfp pilus assembly protein PilX
VLIRRLKNEEGIALVMALGILVVLGILGAAVATYTTAGQRSAYSSRAGVSAYSLAEAGINDALSIVTKAGTSGLWTNQTGYTTLFSTPIVRTYREGTSTVSGSFNTTTSRWTLTSVGTVHNPTQGSRAITRTLTATVRIRPSDSQPVSNPAWNYIMAGRTGTPGGCDEALNNSANIQSPMYVFGNLCLNTPSQVTGGDLEVRGYAKLDVNTNIGTSAAPITTGVHIGGGCSYKGAAFDKPCGTADMVFANPVDNGNPDLTITAPVANFPFWYQNSIPGPTTGCTEQSGTPPVFDTDGVLTDDGYGSVATVFNLTPPSSDYSCIVRNSNSAIIGQLSWNHTTAKLTIQGTIFIDGSITANFGKVVPVDYNGRATIYSTGSVFITNTNLCATVANGDCDFPNWDPNSDFLIFVADGAGGGQVPVGDSIQVKSAHFEGGLWGKNSVDCLTATRTEGPMYAGNEILDNSVYAHTWPITNVPVGMPGNTIVYVTTDPPSSYY